uniref:Heat shock protein 70 n=1 Tax=Panagrolaimus davidi TaxID=227884 RepID=A0A914Q9D4_9BILA
MKQKVQEFVGGISSALTITVPSTFTDSQKDATCAAAFLAGWEYVDLIPEPIAAAFAYLELGNKKYKLMLECQKIKECLSENFEDSLDVVEYDLSFEDFISITRKEFEELSVNLLKKIETCIQDVIEKSEFNHNQIDKVLLVGGGSRMPMIKTLLKNIFPKAEQCCTKHPDEVVAAK